MLESARRRGAAIVYALLRLSPFVRDGRRNQERWERGDGARFEPTPDREALP